MGRCLPKVYDIDQGKNNSTLCKEWGGIRVGGFLFIFVTFVNSVLPKLREKNSGPLPAQGLHTAN